MSLSIDDLITADTPDDFKAKIMTIASSLGLSTTAWQSGGITRTIIAVISKVLGVAAGAANNADSEGIDGLISTIAKAGFLRFASSVTPDPSVALADGTYPAAGVGWLDVLADSVYDVQRIGATFGTAPVTLTNTSAGSYGPFAVGTYHLANTSLKKTYSNTTVLAIGASGDTTATFAADVPGASSTTAASVLTPVTSLVGVSVNAGLSSGVLTGSNAESNAALVQRCLNKLTALGPKVGPGGAYQYFATTATLPVEQGGGGLTLAGGPITRVKAFTSPSNGIVSTYLANDSGAPAGPDVTIIDNYLHDVCVPDAVTEITLPAVDFSVAVVCHVYVPAAFSAEAAVKVQTAITNYIKSLQIGGAAIDAIGTKGIPYDAVIGAIFSGVSGADGTRYIENVSGLTLNTTSTDLVMSPTDVAKTSPTPVVTVHVV